MLSPFDQGSSGSAPDERVQMLTTANSFLTNSVSESLVDGLCTHLCALQCLCGDVGGVALHRILWRCILKVWIPLSHFADRLMSLTVRT